ncbi:hypothetical protein [Streptomyces sp. MJP52]|uniref:hypothetical protein n=1 Tax=Streptomyces sp. MJP52 TaxID=2940555 RepID=UPI0024758A58|nr:hypothetical protein [Streptomyces sp. MJP52]
MAEYPFLAPWVDGLQSRLATVLDEERWAFTTLVQPVRLLEAAAVRLLPTPKFSDDPGFAGLGSEAEKTFRRAWYEWSRRAIWSCHRLDFAVWTVVSDAFGRRRKGKPEAHAAFRWFTTDWICQAREEASRAVCAPWQLVAVKAPALVRTHHREPERDPLTLWEAAVIATYQVAFDRKAGTTALLVPHLVAEQLLACASDDMPVQRPDSRLQRATPRGAAQAMGLHGAQRDCCVIG